MVEVSIAPTLHTQFCLYAVSSIPAPFVAKVYCWLFLFYMGFFIAQMNSENDAGLFLTDASTDFGMVFILAFLFAIRPIGLWINLKRKVETE